MKKLGNKGSVWVWVVSIAIILSVGMAWIGLRLVLETNMPSSFQQTATDYPVMSNFFLSIVDGFCLVMVAGVVIWALSSSGTPGGWQ
jgi:hypothetical protein